MNTTENPEENKESVEEEVTEASSDSPSQGEAKDPRGRPWVDYVPPYEHKYSEDLDERIHQHYSDISAKLKELEMRKLSFVDQALPSPYFEMWVDDSNKLFLASQRLRLRRKSLLKK